MNNTVITVSPAFFIVIAVSAIADRSGIFSFILIAVFIHELGHIAAMRALNIGINALRLRIFGLEICADIPKGRKEAFVMAAGPLANLLSVPLFLVFKNDFFVSLAACSFVLGLFHLLPCEGFDGGSALKALFFQKKREKAVANIVKFLTFTISACLFFAALYLMLTHRFNLSLLILPIYLLLNLFSDRKSTALT